MVKTTRCAISGPLLGPLLGLHGNVLCTVPALYVFENKCKVVQADDCRPLFIIESLSM